MVELMPTLIVWQVLEQLPNNRHATCRRRRPTELQGTYG